MPVPVPVPVPVPTDDPARPGLRIAHQLALTTAEGPGRRFALWVQGCSLACPGCCNPELFPASGGAVVAVSELVQELVAAATTHALEGLTVIGGEPLQQIAGISALAAGAQAAGLGVIVFTGYTWEEAAALPGFTAVAAATDTLVCGRFEGSRREPRVGGRRFIGSTNQRLHHLSDRYAAAELWAGPQALEVRIDGDGRVVASGDPSLAGSFFRGFFEARGAAGPK